MRWTVSLIAFRVICHLLSIFVLEDEREIRAGFSHACCETDVECRMSTAASCLSSRVPQHSGTVRVGIISRNLGPLGSIELGNVPTMAPMSENGVESFILATMANKQM